MCTYSSVSHTHPCECQNIAFVSFLVFTLVQFFFATLARSDAMMTDCSAMMVDVVTYMFNYLAEQYKHSAARSTTKEAYHLHCLYLELIPPLISVITLMIVTIIALRLSLETLFFEPTNDVDDETEEPNVSIMVYFSAMNLLLDVLNVSCFARVDFHNHASSPPGTGNGAVALTDSLHHHETTYLLNSADGIVNQDEDDENDYNWNMCSAWTHICADTLRSVAVLVAAGLSEYGRHISAAQADSGATLLVSVIVLVSLVPLIQGLYQTAHQIYAIHCHGHNIAANADSSV
jgi:Co/Zn/Cd efflux system component